MRFVVFDKPVKDNLNTILKDFALRVKGGSLDPRNRVAYVGIDLEVKATFDGKRVAKLVQEFFEKDFCRIKTVVINGIVYGEPLTTRA